MTAADREAYKRALIDLLLTYGDRPEDADKFKAGIDAAAARVVGR